MITTKNRVFCSYAFTGEDKETVTERMQLIKDAFASTGVDTYCNLFDTSREGLSGPKAFIDAALDDMKTCDVVFIVMTSERRSEGMLIEIGAAYAAGKPLVLARHASANGKTYIDQLATKTIDWESNEDLARLIKTEVVTAD